MEHVRSADGTAIGYRSLGEGEAVLLVHGSIASSSDWVMVARELRDAFRLVSMDRRGRGGSEWGDPYDIDREAEDVAAVAQATGARAVVAHSFGGLVTLRALAQGLPIERLVLYEPPVSVPASSPLHRLEALVRDGALAEAASTFLRAAGVTDAELELIRGSAVWPVLELQARTLPREMAHVRGWRTPPGPFDLPALLVVGGETDSPAFLDGIPALEAALPRVERASAAGQRHLAHVMAAPGFARLLRPFLAA